MSHWTHEVISTSNQHHWRWFNVDKTSCAAGLCEYDVGLGTIRHEDQTYIQTSSKRRPYGGLIIMVQRRRGWANVDTPPIAWRLMVCTHLFVMSAEKCPRSHETVSLSYLDLRDRRNPAGTICWPYVDLMLSQRRRRWTNIGSTYCAYWEVRRWHDQCRNKAPPESSAEQATGPSSLWGLWSVQLSEMCQFCEFANGSLHCINQRCLDHKSQCISHY